MIESKNKLSDILENLERSPSVKGDLPTMVDNLSKLTLGGFLVMAGIVAAILLAAGALLSSYIGEKTATYQHLVDEVNINNNKIDNLNSEIQDLKKGFETSQQEQASQPLK